MVTSKAILSQLNQHAPEIYRRFQVRQIGLFGSHAREGAHSKSDIDILVDFVSPTFDNYMDLKFYLEELFKQKVDLVMLDGLKPRIRPIVLQEVRYAQRS